MPKKQPAEFTYPEGSGPAVQDLIDQVVWALQLHGPFEDEAGSATNMLSTWLTERGVAVPAGLSTVVRDLTLPENGGYVVRDCPSRRTYSIALAKGKTPDKVPFPPNPFPDEEEDEVGEVLDLPTIVAVGPVDESADGAYDVLTTALEIAGLATQLVRELPTRIRPAQNVLSDWVKEMMEDNTRLRGEVHDLTVKLQVAERLADRLIAEVGDVKPPTDDLGPVSG